MPRIVAQVHQFLSALRVVAVSCSFICSRGPPQQLQIVVQLVDLLNQAAQRLQGEALESDLRRNTIALVKMVELKRKTKQKTKNRPFDWYDFPVVS